MTTPVLVAYATKAGSTREVADAVARTLREHGLEADVRPAEEVGTLAPYNAVVLGTALYAGRVHKAARRFLRSHREELAVRPLAVFAMGPKTLADDDVAASRAQLDRALAAHPELRVGPSPSSAVSSIRAGCISRSTACRPATPVTGTRSGRGPTRWPAS